jgi:hypothetical protein
VRVYTDVMSRGDDERDRLRGLIGEGGEPTAAGGGGDCQTREIRITDTARH